MSGRGRQPGQRSRGAAQSEADVQSAAIAWKSEPFSSFDAFPVLSQAKSAYQWLSGDEAGARLTWERCKVYGPVVSQVCSAAEYFSGLTDEAAERQRAFVDNLGRSWIAAAESLPITAPFLASAHYCAGDRKRSQWIAQKASRSCCVVLAGASVCAAAGPAVASSSHLILAAGGAGVVAGIAADALIVARPSIPRPLTPGESFDWLAMRFLDSLRAMAAFDLVLVFWPEHASQISVWVEPISVGDAARLVMGKATTGDDAALAGALDHIPSGVDHVFVLWKTNKGHLFVSERLHDGRVLVEDLQRGTVLPFAHGKQLPMEDLHRVGAGTAEPGHGTGPSAASVSNTEELAAIKVPSVAAKAISGGKAELFSEHALKDGPSVASFQELARAKSMAGYDLMQANCQHYAQDFWKFAVGHRLGMPNQEFLNLFKIFGSPSHGDRMVAPGVLGNASYAISSVHPCRSILDIALLKLPVVPARHDEEEVEVEVDSHPRRGAETSANTAPQREHTWV